jgi:AAA15 family ATPase/GTPase
MKGAQLIVTTHETTLLSLETFRRDQIYFTEKDTETGITDLYSLDEFSVRKDENIQRGYLLGRYGAVPFLQTEEVF